MSSVQELERAAEVELARLGVAEELGWVLAMLAAYATYLQWHTWYVAALALIVAYVVATYPYRRREHIAEDAYHQAAGIGKYSPRG
jgi:hypothetical protein